MQRWVLFCRFQFKWPTVVWVLNFRFCNVKWGSCQGGHLCLPSEFPAFSCCNFKKSTSHIVHHHYHYFISLSHDTVTLYNTLLLVRIFLALDGMLVHYRSLPTPPPLPPFLLSVCHDILIAWLVGARRNTILTVIRKYIALQRTQNTTCEFLSKVVSFVMLKQFSPNNLTSVSVYSFLLKQVLHILS